jgi:aminoglycoside phosphotransferase (APT) family kinase protein
MEREFKIISELHPVFLATPKPILFSELEEIVGSPFFIMERKNGMVIDTSFPEEISVTKELCQQLSEVMVNKLVELHGINYRDTGLGAISKPEGFTERQVHAG